MITGISIGSAAAWMQLWFQETTVTKWRVVRFLYDLSDGSRLTSTSAETYGPVIPAVTGPWRFWGCYGIVDNPLLGDFATWRTRRGSSRDRPLLSTFSFPPSLLTSSSSRKAAPRTLRRAEPSPLGAKHRSLQGNRLSRAALQSQRFCPRQGALGFAEAAGGVAKPDQRVRTLNQRFHRQRLEAACVGLLGDCGECAASPGVGWTCSQ